ncbi:putative GNAT family acetyltransferase [Colletotrichum asianum]
MEITIQSAKSEDIPAIVEFIKQARSVMFPWIDAESQNQHAQRELENFSNTYLDNPNGAFLTAYGNGQIIAAIGYAPYDDRFPELGLGREGVVEFVRLYVNPAWRRAGLASKLCAALKQRARDAGMKKLYLHTHPFLEGAIGFWERQGFSILQVDDDPVWQTTHMSKAL